MRPLETIFAFYLLVYTMRIHGAFGLAARLALNGGESDIVRA